MKWLQYSVLVSLFLMVFASTAFSMSNQAIHWGFQKGKDEQPAQAGKEYDEILEKYGGFYKANSNEKVIYLTFDNGYENGYTENILDTLKKEKVPGAFFVTGHYLKSVPDLVKRMHKEGHIIGNHSWTHPDLTQVNDEKLREELRLVKEETARLTKQKSMPYLRPPRGVLSERTLKLAKDEGYTHVMWSLAFKDWETNNQRGWQYAYDNIMAQIHPGAVLLLHSVSKDNAEALPKAIKDLKKKGYRFESLDHYMKSRKKS
ncbi:delta-lactam-biosynthetic de-N-acetylase [Bacillaceae bacterium SAS-127]|nr:delta-lactam-biosynthetic de-N-acetylase [Bacillaceae bacterium SAS-127]